MTPLALAFPFIALAIVLFCAAWSYADLRRPEPDDIGERLRRRALRRLPMGVVAVFGPGVVAALGRVLL